MKKLRSSLILFTFIIISFTVAFAGEINNFEVYEKNQGKDYRLSVDERYKLLDEGSLLIWKWDEKTEKGEYVPLKDIRDIEGNRVDIKKFFDIYGVDLDGDGKDELFILPNVLPILEDNGDYSDEWFMDSYFYRATIVKKEGNNYTPYDKAEIEGDYSYILDIRDLNNDGISDVILGSSAGASSYCDIAEVFHFDKKKETLMSQVFSQWVGLYDFNNDMVYELAVSYPGGTSAAHAYWASWSDIFKFSGGEYIEVSKDYPEFYEKIYIPRLIDEMIYLGGPDDYIEPALNDRVILIEKAWKIVLDRGFYKIIDEMGARNENSKGLEEIDKGNLEKAIGHFKKAVELNPRNPEFYNNCGYVYELLEAYESAREWYGKTLCRKPDRAVAWYNLGCCKEVKEEIAGCFYNYITFLSDKEAAKEAIKDLSSSHKSKAVREAAKEVYESYTVD